MAVLKKLILHLVLIVLPIILVCPWAQAQTRQSDSLRKKQEAYSLELKLKAQRQRDSVELAKYKQANAAVISYDSKGNKIEEQKNKDGSRTITTIIKRPPVLNRKFSLDTVNLDSVVLKVVKSKYRLFVYHKGNILTAYKCVFGPNVGEQKLQEGDRRTPEGIFTITDCKKHCKWEMFMCFNYPNEESIKIHEDAKKKGLIPPQARIGGSVGIHGIWPNGDNVIELKHNWTDGCISLKNSDVLELNTLIKPGYTNLIIVK